MLGVGFPNSTSSSDRPLLLALGVGVLGGQTGLLEWEISVLGVGG